VVVVGDLDLDGAGARDGDAIVRSRIQKRFIDTLSRTDIRPNSRPFRFRISSQPFSGRSQKEQIRTFSPWESTPRWLAYPKY